MGKFQNKIKPINVNITGKYMKFRIESNTNNPTMPMVGKNNLRV
jgi:hypothetical protein